MVIVYDDELGELLYSIEQYSELHGLEAWRLLRPQVEYIFTVPAHGRGLHSIPAVTHKWVGRSIFDDHGEPALGQPARQWLCPD
jgi:hypothetical protein